VDAQKASDKVPRAGCYLLDFCTWRMCHAMDIVRKLIHGIPCNERGAQFKLIDIKILPLYCIRLMLKSFSPVLCILAVPIAESFTVSVFMLFKQFPGLQDQAVTKIYKEL
jgi:hypothetical protein